MKLTEEFFINYRKAREDYYSNVIMSGIFALVSELSGHIYVAITYTIITMLLLLAELFYFSKFVEIEEAENRINKMLSCNENFKFVIVFIVSLQLLKYLI